VVCGRSHNQNETARSTSVTGEGRVREIDSAACSAWLGERRERLSLTECVLLELHAQPTPSACSGDTANNNVRVCLYLRRQLDAGGEPRPIQCSQFLHRFICYVPWVRPTSVAGMEFTGVAAMPNTPCLARRTHARILSRSTAICCRFLSCLHDLTGGAHHYRDQGET
jgi:hypothetical protein